MAKGLVEQESLTNIANAIRAKNGKLGGDKSGKYNKNKMRIEYRY